MRWARESCDEMCAHLPAGCAASFDACWAHRANADQAGGVLICQTEDQSSEFHLWTCFPSQFPMITSNRMPEAAARLRSTALFTPLLLPRYLARSRGPAGDLTLLDGFVASGPSARPLAVDPQTPTWPQHDSQGFEQRSPAAQEATNDG
jgi:hypothetical protein